MFRTLAASLSPAKRSGIAAIASSPSVISSKKTAASPSAKNKATSSPKKLKVASSSPKKSAAAPKSPKAVKTVSPKSAGKKTGSAKKTAVLEASPTPVTLPAAPANTPAVALNFEEEVAPVLLATPMSECRPLFTEFEAAGEEVTATAPEVQDEVTFVDFSASTHMPAAVETILKQEAVIITAAAAPVARVRKTVTFATEEAVEWTGEEGANQRRHEQNIISAMELAQQVPDTVAAVAVEMRAPRTGAIAPEPEAVMESSSVPQESTHTAATFEAFESGFAAEVQGVEADLAEPEIAVAGPNEEVLAAFEQGFEAPQICYPEVGEESQVTLSGNVHTDNLVSAEQEGAESAASALPIEEIAAPVSAPAEEPFSFKSLF